MSLVFKKNKAVSLKSETLVDSALVAFPGPILFLPDKSTVNVYI